MRITAEEVEAMLNGAIGAELTQQAGLTDSCLRLMNAWQPLISPPEELEKLTGGRHALLSSSEKGSVLLLEKPG